MDSQFTVKSLPSSTIEGAFRLHLPPDGLEKLSLNIGDVCLLTNEHGEVGHAIAWRATDRMGNIPKTRPAKMTETMQQALNLKEGTLINVRKTDAQILKADRVTFKDMTDDEASRDEFDGWDPRCHVALLNCEAICRSMAFDVTAKKGAKRRFLVTGIETDDLNAKPTSLFRLHNSTTVVISNDPLGHARDDDSQQPFEVPQLDGASIGGLEMQIRNLNKRIRRLWREVTPSGPTPSQNQHVLIHGYEGTGKSMLLDQLERSNPERSFRLNWRSFTAGSPTKSRESIQLIFKKAVTIQPSIILIDDLDRIAPAEDSALAFTIYTAMQSLKRTRVMAVGTASSTGSVEKSLLQQFGFSATIELPIPNVHEREQILNVLQNESTEQSKELSKLVSRKAQGFTARDLGVLVENAYSQASDREPMEPGTQDPEATPSSSDVHLQYEDFESVLQHMRPTALREISFEPPKIRWSDIGGSESTSKRFDETIGWQLLYPHFFEDAQLTPPKGVLLYGPPGCSKTLTAQAVASTYDFNFIAVKGAELISMYVGESERAVREVFRKARQAAPCVIFFDEIDSIGAARDDSGTKGLNVLTTLLTEMDGFEQLKGVVVLAATNRPEILDPALMRPGRFDSHVYVGPPDETARKAIFDIALKGVPIVEPLDMARFISDTHGYSGAELVKVCQIAKFSLIRRRVAGSSIVGITAEDLEEGVSQTKPAITQEMLDAYAAFGRR